MPKIDDDKGLSLILVHTENGGRVVGSISEKVLLYKLTIEAIDTINEKVKLIVPISHKRDKFFDELFKTGITKAYKKVTDDSVIKRIVKKILK